MKKEAEEYFSSLSIEDKLSFVLRGLRELEAQIRAERSSPLGLSDSAPPPESFERQAEESQRPRRDQRDQNEPARKSAPDPGLGASPANGGSRSPGQTSKPGRGHGPKTRGPGFSDEGESDDFDFSGLDPDSLVGGSAHAVHHLRLLDVAERYQGLLKKYGYVRGIPEPEEILARDRIRARNEEEPKRVDSDGAEEKTPPSPDGDDPQGRRTAWSDWVARDQKTLDHPRKYDWKEWVAQADERKPDEETKKD